MGDERLVKHVYQSSRSGSSDWCERTRELLRELGLGEWWRRNTLPEGGLEEWDAELRSRIQARERRQWKERMEMKPKLRTYMQLKGALEFEPYLRIGNAAGRAAITALRGGTNKLRIEIGRPRITGSRGVRRLGRDERKCLLCEAEEIEDEAHFLLACDAYERQRRDMLLVVALELKTTVEQLKEWEPIQLLRVLIGNQRNRAIHDAVASFCAGRMAWRDKFVKRYLDFGT